MALKMSTGSSTIRRMEGGGFGYFEMYKGYSITAYKTTVHGNWSCYIGIDGRSAYMRTNSSSIARMLQRARREIRTLTKQGDNVPLLPMLYAHHQKDFVL